MTAYATYFNTRRDIQKEITKLQTHLADYNPKEQIHWGHVGDMGHILSALKEINEGLEEETNDNP